MKSKHEIINEMCLTSNHSYGMDDKTDDSLTSGMTKFDKACLHSMMSQIYDHHISPIVNEVKELEIKLFAIADHLNIWASKKALFDDEEFRPEHYGFECIEDAYNAGDDDASISFARALLDSINDFTEVFPPNSFILMNKDHQDKMESENNKLKEGIKQEAAYSQKWADEHAGTDRGLRHQERADRLMELLK